ncbi:tetratricopeptide repeat protein [Shewanella oncorhynchi]|uniref:tetratricopeptide repeat protein n=1 Tax=Shewanella TaxID=22 RepID=UPI0021D8DC04|nr:hypothetical protein [Shewanella sp. SM69]MCU8040670.1 hypothetical protein [Shewanella sp. SM69]
MDFFCSEKLADLKSDALNFACVDSSNILANAYLKGEGVERNSEQALYWIVVSASLGNLKAQLYMGNFMENINWPCYMAASFYKSAADQGCAESMAAYGSFLKEIDDKSYEGLNLIHQAYKLGAKRACYELGRLGDMPDYLGGTPNGRAASLKYYKEGADKGHRWCKNALASIEKRESENSL